MASSSASSCCWVVLFLMLIVTLAPSPCAAAAIEVGLGSKLLARQRQSWVSGDGSFAFGFASVADDGGDHRVGLQLAIWFAQLPGDQTLVWSANRNSPVGENAVVELDATGNLVLLDNNGAQVWMSNTSAHGVKTAVMSGNGNFMLLDSMQRPAWQSFSHPSDTLLPGQVLAASQQLTSKNGGGRGGYYALEMLQQTTSLSLGLTYYGFAETHNNASTGSYTNNYSYWAAPEISNVTGDVIAVLDEAGSFGILYGDSSDGAVYVYKNDADRGGLSSAANQSIQPSILRRLILETNGNLRLYRWDNDLNGSRQWVPEWAAVSNPCDIAGVCGNGVCSLGRSKKNVSCTCLPGTTSSRVGAEVIEHRPQRQQQQQQHYCSGNPSSLLNATCEGPHEKKNHQSQFKMMIVQQANYYFSGSTVIANYSDVSSVSKCGDTCLSNCECVASVYALNEETPYCWILRRLSFGGFEDAGSTLFIKVGDNVSAAGLPHGNTGESGKGSEEGDEDKKALILPIVLCMGALIGLLCFLLYYSTHRRRRLKQALENSLVVVSGAPMSFTYRDLQGRTANFSQLLGTGGFGSVYKGFLGDGTLIAVKKLDKVLPHGEREFITEVNTIGSMHHMNLVRLCGYCSEGSHRLLVYEFMKNGSLDKWIFPTNYCRDKLLEWPTRFKIAIATARGIAYFHEQCRNRIIHCDIKPENILLDENFSPKVSDFGLAKLMGREHSHVVTMVRGTRGYLAPEWVSNRPITVKADVYSYGMLLLEIVGGRRNLDMSYEADSFFYPGCAYKEMANGTPLKAADKRLEGAVDEEELVRALKVAFWCIQDEVSMRPSMGEVVKMLEGSVNINPPMMPQTVLELIEEGLDHVYRAMKREFNHYSSFTMSHTHPSSHATCSYSIMSPR